MIELQLPTPQGYVGQRLIVSELDLEIEDEIETAAPIPKSKDETNYGRFAKMVLASSKKEFTSADFQEYAITKLASAYLDVMVKRNLIRKTDRKRSIPRGKPQWIHEHLPC